MGKEKINNKIHAPIDFLIMWVDGNDSKWKKKRDSHLDLSEKGDVRDSRYRDWGTLKYLFRGIERYAPFVNKVFLVTDNQIPDWINTNNQKLRIVDHKDFIPKEFLPTFNANAIETNVFRIKDLSENFVLFNDDTFIVNETKEEDFFNNDLPCDSAILNPMVTYDTDVFFKMVFNDLVIINKHFDKKENIKSALGKWYNLKYGKMLVRNILLSPWKHFMGFYDFHLPNSLKKSIIEEVWKLEEDVLINTSKSKFRNTNTDVNQWLFRYWQLASGQFYPRNIKFGSYYTYPLNEDELSDAILGNRNKVICLNDIDGEYDFEAEKQKTIRYFENKFPDKSSFEL